MAQVLIQIPTLLTAIESAEKDLSPRPNQIRGAWGMQAQHLHDLRVAAEWAQKYPYASPFIAVDSKELSVIGPYLDEIT